MWKRHIRKFLSIIIAKTEDIDYEKLRGSTSCRRFIREIFRTKTLSKEVIF